MKRFAVFIQTLVSVVDISKNTTAELPVGVISPVSAGFVTKEHFEQMAKEARKSFGIQPNQQPKFQELPPVVHIFLEEATTTLCGRDYSWRRRAFAKYSQFANCKNCLKKQEKLFQENQKKTIV